MVVGRFVDRGDQPGTYRLGMRLLELGNMVKARLSVREAAVEPMRDLHRKTGQTVNLSVRQGDEIVYVERSYSERSGMQVVRAIGGRAPLHLTSSGKLFCLGEARAARISDSSPLTPWGDRDAACACGRRAVRVAYERTVRGSSKARKQLAAGGQVQPARAANRAHHLHARALACKSARRTRSRRPAAPTGSRSARSCACRSRIGSTAASRTDSLALTMLPSSKQAHSEPVGAGLVATVDETATTIVVQDPVRGRWVQPRGLSELFELTDPDCFASASSRFINRSMT